ncbi:MAG: protease [Chloroflexi bacterium]|nr:protease [Chloroflexota bacterium]
MKETQRNLFECALEAEETYVVAEPVEIRFSLHNRTNRTLYVLTWYTPLEGIAGEIFRVTRDGDDVPYQGILAKRGDPSRDEYVALEPGTAASAVVDLAEAYDLSQAGRYHVEFASRLHDVADDASSIPRKRDDHQPHELPCRAASFRIVQPGARTGAGLAIPRSQP